MDTPAQYNRVERETFRYKQTEMYSKYKAKKIVVDWIKFDSKLEADYYLYLKWEWVLDKTILQPKFVLQDKFVYDWKTVSAITYVADFQIWDVVIDIKWLPTPVAVMKRKMFMHRYGDKYRLDWLVRYKWERVCYFENQKRIRENRKNKSLKSN